MQNKRQLVIGLGEVGLALQKILSCDGMDTGKGIDPLGGQYDILHIAFPYSDKFQEAVIKYKTKFDADLIIIHSSVPIGTSKLLNAVHSPIRGVHPFLEDGIRTFRKYFGGERSPVAAKIFSDLGLEVFCVSNSNNTEALKLWDTTQYGIMILLNKEINNFCTQNRLDFDFIYKEANISYNKGYSKLNRPDVVRPYLRHMEGKIGGHCVVENAALLNSESARMIIEQNETL